MSQAQKEAQEIIDQHRTIIRKADKYGYLLPDDEVYLAKECAIIHVKGIINNYGVSVPIGVLEYHRISHWKSVLNEIEKI